MNGWRDDGPTSSCNTSLLQFCYVSLMYARAFRRQVRKCIPKCLFDDTWFYCNIDLLPFNLKVSQSVNQSVNQSINQSINHRYVFGWRHKSRRSESQAPMDGCQWHDVQAGVKRCVFRAVLKVPNVPESWMEAGSLYCCLVRRQQGNVGGSQKRRESAVQGCSNARAQCLRWLVSVQLTRQVSRCTRADDSKPSLIVPSLKLTR